MKKSLLIILALFLIATLSAGALTPKVTVPLRFDHYYTYEMVVEALQLLHKKYPALTKLDEVGKTEEGRMIYCMTINNPKTGNQLSKPGIYVDGNIHGNEIQAGEVCLYLLDYLLQKYGNNKELTKLVDNNCFYVVPVINADGRYHFLKDGNTDSTNRGLRRPHDDDGDGLLDEDFPDDLDGDGNICRMRKRDPNGRYKSDPTDPRLLVRVKPGEKGEWTLLGNEGIDNDGDGELNEDSEGYVDPNRNWGFQWQPKYVQNGSGDYPFSGVGINALARFIHKRPNICLAWSFHNFGGMFLRGPSTGTQEEYDPRDIAVYDFLGKQGERITPGYKYLISYKDLYSTYGSSAEWMGMVQGAYAFTGELFTHGRHLFRTQKEREKGKNVEESFFFPNSQKRLEMMKFSDHLTHGELLKPWKPFKHPTYGDIEIGGWVKMSLRLPPPFMLKDLVHRNASTVIFSARNTPEIKMEIFEKR
ncbi:MAG: hypothetical protein GY757_59920, partial [bacterium]|nr:hypothetical protein [bacterium]